ncbi:MAG: acetyl-CoA carboxylase biotin carboxyl carrier protein [Pararhodobacter sp.]|nr:acetyl-CoA carboxylase biotin carboxyl carrier protein [Pararhodobacter sp.]
MSNERNADDVAFIQALAEILDSNDLNEISVEREYGENDRLRVSVAKHAPAAPAASMAYAPPAAQPAAERASAPAPTAASEDPADLPGAVASPMVGTAYLSPEPNAEPFVRIGQQVIAGQTLMIIEAMKTMNHIPAPHAGTVKRILVEDGTPVEYGAPLMIVA